MWANYCAAIWRRVSVIDFFRAFLPSGGSPGVPHFLSQGLLIVRWL